MRKLVGKLNFAQTSVMGRAGRVPPRPLYDVAMGVGGNSEKGGGSALA